MHSVDVEWNFLILSLAVYIATLGFIIQSCYTTVSETVSLSLGYDTHSFCRYYKRHPYWNFDTNIMNERSRRAEKGSDFQLSNCPYDQHSNTLKFTRHTRACSEKTVKESKCKI